MSRLAILVLCLLVVASLIPCIYFITADLSWDMHGHFFSAYFIKKYLWPSPTGWNHLSLMGYPQGYFYPPFFHWLTAALSFFMPLETSFKLLVTLSLVLFPIVLFFALKNLKLNDDEAILACLFVFLFLLMMKGDIGGDFYSTLHVGLVTHQFGMFLLFLFLAILDTQFLNKKRNFFATIILSLIILTHIFSAISAFIFLFVFGILNVRSKKQAVNFLLILLFSFFLTAFWIIPFLYYLKFTEGIVIPGGSPLLHPFALFLIIISLVAIIVKKDKKSLPFIALLVAFLLLTMFGAIIPVNLHFFRFHSIIYTLFGIVLSRLFMIAPFKKYNKFLCIFLIIFSLFLAFVFASDLARNDVSIRLNIEAVEKLVKDKGYGVVISTINPTKSQHAISYSLLLKEIKLVDGLFVESSLNSRAINTLKRELNEHVFVWGVLPYKSLESKKTLLNHLNYLGINFLFLDTFTYNYTSTLIIPKELYQVDVAFNDYVLPFYLVKIDNNLIEVANNPLPVKKQEWNKKVEEWWDDPSLIRRILVESDFPLPQHKVNETEIEIKILEERNDYIKFEVISEEVVPVLIKISYFPNWRAFVDGEEVKIYRASPNLMLVFAKGVVELKFIKDKPEIIGLTISILSLLLLLLFSSLLSFPFSKFFSKLK